MHRFRFSIGGLMVLIVVMGVGFAALHFPTPLWGNVWFSFPLAALTLAIPAAIYSQGERRAFWVGFATCGWVYFVVSMAPWFQAETGCQLVTTTILDLLGPYFVREDYLLRTYIRQFNPPSAPISPTPWQVWNFPDFSGGTKSWRYGWHTVQSPPTYFRVGHGVFSLVIAFLGGEAVRYLATMRSQPERAER
jgi:hypothetical protein